MPNRRINTMNVHEILRLKRRGISHRKTVDKYASWLEAQGYLVGEMPEMEELEQQLVKEGQQQALPQNVSSVEPFREVVVKLRERGVEMAAIHQRLKPYLGIAAPYVQSSNPLWAVKLVC